jgi:hypothetical protein
MESNHRAGFHFCLDFLVSNLSLSHCCILYPFEASGTLRLFKCQTKANQRHLLAVTPPDLDLCSLITISDHLVLVHLEERTQTFKTIYIAAIAAVNSLQSRQRFHMLSTLYLSNSVTILPEKHPTQDCPNSTPAQQNLPYLCQHQPLKSHNGVQRTCSWGGLQ